jgi:dTDP-4-dehydrorhamnose 3,5-epimerase
MNSFSATATPLSGLQVVERAPRRDQRGFLARIFCAEELAGLGWRKPVAQINHTVTLEKGTIRGMHFQQPPWAEMKLVSCLRGEVFDVAVDIRQGSPTFLKWYGLPLSAENCQALLIPEGFAHGFQTVTDNVELLYCHSAGYAREAEGGLNPSDPVLNIHWPEIITEMSEKDASRPLIDHTFQGVRL